MDLKTLGRRGLAALALAAGALVALPAMAADHRDGGAAQADPSSDINDVYSWMNGEKVVLAMTVSPFAAADATFSPEVQYVFNVDAWGGLAGSLAEGAAPAFSTKVHCEFDEAQIAQCWVHRDGEILDYLLGDASSEEGIAGTSSQLFAGLRADPFYFYLTGFNDARATVAAAFPDIDVSNSTLCPELSPAQLEALGDDLTIGLGGQALNDFDEANTLAIVIEIDKSLFIDPENTVLSISGTTHAKP